MKYLPVLVPSFTRFSINVLMDANSSTRHLEHLPWMFHSKQFIYLIVKFSLMTWRQDAKRTQLIAVYRPQAQRNLIDTSAFAGNAGPADARRDQTSASVGSETKPSNPAGSSPGSPQNVSGQSCHVLFLK